MALEEGFTRHMGCDRQDRDEFIRSHVGSGNLVAKFLVDKGHWNGNEIHEVYDNAIIEIKNERTGNLITKLLARRGQLLRYTYGWNGQVLKAWDANGKPIAYNKVRIPAEVLRKAEQAQRQGWNYK